MKPGIHPEYETAKITCACGRVTETRTTVGEIHVEICSHCHPFFTGRQKLVDTAGRVERFKAKYGAAGKTPAKSETSEEAAAPSEPGAEAPAEVDAEAPSEPEAEAPDATVAEAPEAEAPAAEAEAPVAEAETPAEEPASEAAAETDASDSEADQAEDEDEASA